MVKYLWTVGEYLRLYVYSYVSQVDERVFYACVGVYLCDKCVEIVETRPQFNFIVPRTRLERCNTMFSFFQGTSVTSDIVSR